MSRVDTQIDKVLESNASSEALALRGRMAIVNAKLVYRRFREIFHGEVFAALRGTGRTCRTAAVASASTKNPRCRDVIYIEKWIGSETVNTLPLATQKAFLDHGRVHGATIVEGWADAEQDLGKLGGLRIDLDVIAERLQVDGSSYLPNPTAKRWLPWKGSASRQSRQGVFRAAGDLIKGS